MATGREIQTIIAELEVLETVTRAYGEIASLRMKNTRQGVLNARQFIEDLKRVFEDVRVSYMEDIQKLVKQRMSKKGKEDITFLSHNGKSVAVLLSANTGLYGDIVHKTFNLFLEEVRKNESEVTLIGHQGLSFFESMEPNRPHTYFDLPDNGFTQEAASKIIRHIVKYKSIHLFYGRFQNVLIQQPDMVEISSQVNLETIQKDAKRKKYLFEPSLDRVLMFFETEMFASLFEQTVRESQLAKFASRILAMDQASENIKEERKKLNLERLAAVHRIADRKQLNSLASVLMTV